MSSLQIAEFKGSIIHPVKYEVIPVILTLNWVKCFIPDGLTAYEVSEKFGPDEFKVVTRFPVNSRGREMAENFMIRRFRLRRKEVEKAETGAEA